MDTANRAIARCARTVYSNASSATRGYVQIAQSLVISTTSWGAKGVGNIFAMVAWFRPNASVKCRAVRNASTNMTARTVTNALAVDFGSPQTSHCTAAAIGAGCCGNCFVA